MGSLPFDWNPQPEAPETPVLSVGELSARIAQSLAEGVPGLVRVAGEISTFNERRGHWYLSLQDDDAMIQCVMWASDVRRAGSSVAEGDSVEVVGELVHWAPQGRTQLRLRRIEAAGMGGRRAAWERLCKQLRAKGWFDEKKKKPLPRCPQCIAVLTSSSAAALHDVRATSAARWPACRLILVDVPVQGDGAAEAMVAALHRLELIRDDYAIDAILITRGGGASEDLVAFDDRRLAEAIHACSIPVVAAIGHESDTTIAELVADRRASTPTQAMMILLPDRQEEAERLDLFEDAIRRRWQNLLSSCQARLDHTVALGKAAWERRLTEPREMLAAASASLSTSRPDAMVAQSSRDLADRDRRLDAVLRSRFNEARNRLNQLDVTGTMRHTVAWRKARLDRQVDVLHAIGPRAVLARGYSLTLDAHGHLIRTIEGVSPGDEIRTLLAGGHLDSTISGTGESEERDLPSAHGETGH